MPNAHTGHMEATPAAAAAAAATFQPSSSTPHTIHHISLFSPQVNYQSQHPPHPLQSAEAFHK